MGSVTPVSEAVAAIAVIVLAVLGLVNVVPGVMVAVATIVVGAAILLQGAGTASAYSRLITVGAATGAEALGGGITLEFLAGGAGIVLGILALFAHVATLVPAAVIVFGGSLLLSGGAMVRRASLEAVPPTATPQERAAAMIAEQMAGVATGAQIMIGIAAIVLGILALVPIHDATLSLVGLLAIGAALLIAATATGGAVVTNVFRLGH
jgi:hypothetical protein